MEKQAPAARPWIANTMLAFAVFATCWTGAVLYWRSSGSMPSGRDIGQLLLALPAAILLALWLAKKSLMARSSAPASQPAAAGVPAQPARQRGPLPGIAAGAVRLRGGNTLEELSDALRTNSAPCELDPELTDEDGYPVLSGRIDSADPAAQQEAMSPWLAQRGMAELAWSEEQWRALALGSAVVAELVQHALAHPLLPDYLAAAPAARAGIALPTLQLTPVLPLHWKAAQHQAGADWFLHLVKQQGWPEQRLRLAPSFAGAAAAFALIDDIAQGSDAGLTLLVACESHIGEDSVRDWGERGLLFTGRTPRGQVPGEGAAGLLLADGAQAALRDPGSVARMAGTCDGRRAVSADAAGNINSELLASLGKQALQESKTEPAAVTTLCGDPDLRPARTGELMGMANAVLPQLDLSTQMMSVGACCGTADAVGPIAALALARHAALAGAGQVLCVSNSDPYYRCAVVVRGA